MKIKNQFDNSKDDESKEKKIPLTNKAKSIKRNSRNIELPWLDSRGIIKSDSEIECLGKEWTAQTWNDYLNYSIGKLNIDEEKGNLKVFKFGYVDTKIMLQGSELIESLTKNEKYKNIEFALLIAIDSLGKKQKEIIKLFYWKKLPLAEISRQMETTINSISSLKSRATKKLKTILASNKFRNDLFYMSKNKTLKPRILIQLQWLKD